MCLPPSYQASSSGDQSADEKHTLGQGLADLERTREDVVKEVCGLCCVMLCLWCGVFGVRLLLLERTVLISTCRC